jgi:hypothetical protein
MELRPGYASGNVHERALATWNGPAGHEKRSCGMKAIFGVLSLLIVVVIVGLLAKKQLSSAVAPAAPGAPVQGVAVPAGTPKQQQEQFKGAVEGVMQQARPMPEEPK